MSLSIYTPYIPDQLEGATIALPIAILGVPTSDSLSVEVIDEGLETLRSETSYLVHGNNSSMLTFTGTSLQVNTVFSHLFDTLNLPGYDFVIIEVTDNNSQTNYFRELYLMVAAPLVINQVASHQTINAGVATAITGLSVSGGSDYGVEVSLNDSRGNLSIVNPGITIYYNNSHNLDFYGSISQVNAALSQLYDTSSVTGNDLVQIQVFDDMSEQFASSNILVTTQALQTTATLTSSSASISHGQPITLTATESNGGNGATTLTGTVIFFDGSSQIGTGTLHNGVATLTTSSLAVGMNCSIPLDLYI